ncbi:hypothetical protein OHB00_37245 [Streptomyces sp. NBC_00631]|uniref:hypothetical protein n=1 Tax=Streptomyces sp. NBC_00631 TaxID=2975793 RepID=UPI0030E181A9
MRGTHGPRSGSHGDVVCPVVPVLIGDVPSGLIAHLIEQSGVASDAARFRLQAMADHGGDDVDTAIDIYIRDACIRSAREAIASTHRAA